MLKVWEEIFVLAPAHHQHHDDQQRLKWPLWNPFPELQIRKRQYPSFCIKSWWIFSHGAFRSFSHPAVLYFSSLFKCFYPGLDWALILYIKISVVIEDSLCALVKCYKNILFCFRWNLYHEFSFDQVCEIELWHKDCKGKRKMWFFAAETNLISSTTSKEANFRPQNWFDSCVYSIVSVLFHFMDIFEPGLPNKKIKRNLFLTNQQAVKHKITIEFCFISASFALTFANLTNEKWNKSIPKYFLTKFQLQQNRVRD